MQETITIDVPETTTSRFVIATAYPPTDPSALVPWQVITPYAREAAERLGSRSLMITTYRAADSPIDLSQVTAELTDDKPNESWMRAATHHVEVSATLPITDQPRGAQIARAVARGIADFVRGVPADLTTGQILPSYEPGEPICRDTDPQETDRFCLGDSWVADDLPRAACPCGTPPQTEDTIDACRQVRLTTTGLSRFGLPELRIDQVSCAHDRAALNVLRTVAGRLLHDHWAWLATEPADRSRDIRRRLVLGIEDHGRFWNCACDCGDSIAVWLTSPRPGLIDVGPPAELGTTTNAWIWAITPPWAFSGLGCGGRKREIVAAHSGQETLPELSYLPCLSYEEKGRLLDELLTLVPELCEMADDLADDWLSTAGRHAVAQDVQAALSNVPANATLEAVSWLLRTALRPFHRDIERRIRLGKTVAATELTVGTLRALHAGRDDPHGSPFLHAPGLADEQIGALLRLCGRLPIRLPMDELHRYPPTRHHGIPRAG